MEIKTNGPGRYDPETTYVRLAAQAEGVLVLVFNGRYGDGFSAQLPAELLFKVPAVLRKMADDIDAQQQMRGAS